MTSKSDDAAQATPEEVLAEVSRKMDRSVQALRHELESLRTGRATPSLVENMMIDYYGSLTPLKQIASISAPDPQAILVQPWDKQSLRDIERGLIKSDMGFNPSNDGTNITVPIPPLNTERRQELVKLLKQKIEDGKISVRNVRRDGLESLRKMERGKTISQDQNRRAQDQLQKTTDGHTKTIDEVGVAKEAEIMQV